MRGCVDALDRCVDDDWRGGRYQPNLVLPFPFPFPFPARLCPLLRVRHFQVRQGRALLVQYAYSTGYDVRDINQSRGF